ncbi:hypothetical protein OLK001_25570 [Synechocystis sp. LKSZ1]
MNTNKKSTHLNQYSWSPFQPVLSYVESLISSDFRVLEIGPGHIPFSAATEFIDWQSYPSHGSSKTKIHELDINIDPLPYEDKSLDFIYCRHVLEDIADLNKGGALASTIFTDYFVNTFLSIGIDSRSLQGTKVMFNII